MAELTIKLTLTLITVMLVHTKCTGTTSLLSQITRKSNHKWTNRGGLSTVLFWVLLGGSEGVFTPVDRLICSEIGIKIITKCCFLLLVRFAFKSSQVKSPLFI